MTKNQNFTPADRLMRAVCDITLCSTEEAAYAAYNKALDAARDRRDALETMAERIVPKIIAECSDHRLVPILNGTVLWCPACRVSKAIEIDYEKTGWVSASEAAAVVRGLHDLLVEARASNGVWEDLHDVFSGDV